MTAEEQIEKIKEYLSNIFDNYTEDNIVDSTARNVARGIQKIIASDEAESEESP